MIIPKEYTVVRRIAHLAGINLLELKRNGIPVDDEGEATYSMYINPIIVEAGNREPHIHYRSSNYIRVGSEWLQNNLTDEEMAQWVALRLLGKLDPSTTCKDEFGNVANYGGEAVIPLSRDSDGKLGVYQNRGFLDKAIKGAVVNAAKIIVKNVLVGKIDA